MQTKQGGRGIKGRRQHCQPTLSWLAQVLEDLAQLALSAHRPTHPSAPTVGPLFQKVFARPTFLALDHVVDAKEGDLEVGLSQQSSVGSSVAGQKCIHR